jgi:hypothetical protein
MKRISFIASAVSAICLARPLKALANLAQRHTSIWYCESPVVWLNTASRIYYYKGDRWFGRTDHGAYSCEKEAIAAGHRARLGMATS